MAIAIGQKAPEFCMETTKNLEALDHKAKLSDYLGKWLVMFFYPLDFTFVCPTEIRGFNSRLTELVDCPILWHPISQNRFRANMAF